MDNRGNVLSPAVLAAVNVHDTCLLPESIRGLTALTKQLGIDLYGSFATFDPAFYSNRNHQVIEASGMLPVIKPNHRNTKDPRVIAEREAVFADVRSIYHLRFTGERNFAWEDKYRRLVVRYERKQTNARGWRDLAAALVNFRWCFRET